MSGNSEFLDDIEILEPYGHSTPETKIERFWKSTNGPISLLRRRTIEYDAYSGMTYSPMKYIMRPFNLRCKLPSDAWIYKKFIEFVKTEFAQGGSPDLPEKWPPVVEREIYIQDSFLEDFLVESDSFEKIDIKLKAVTSPREMAESIYDLICHPRIGSKKNRENNDKDKFVKMLVPTIEERSRLVFVLPGFPFKDQNRFRVPFEGDIPDIGEISFMIRLHRLTQALYQVHPFGVDVIVLTDGELYQEIFGLPSEVVSNYMKRLKAYRNRLNLQGTVSFISLKDLIDRAGDDPIAWTVAAYIKKRIKDFLSQNRTGITETFRILVSGMKWNLDTRLSLARIKDDICWSLLRDDCKIIDQEYLDLWNELDARAIKAAFEYASINLMLGWYDLIRKFFPGCIRGTVHPKKGQFALSGSGKTFAWNGVAWSKEWPKNIDDIEIRPFLSLSDYPVIRQVKIENSNLHCFYTGGCPNKNINAAKYVLSPKGWSIGEIYGRELILSDLEEFIELGVDDKFYSWEREFLDEKRFKELFFFRLDHYKKYGFGVHGIWLEGNLIGQCGLQVLDNEADEVEMAIFLSKRHTHRGIGSMLANHILTRSREVGMETIYGVVRPNNPEGLSIVKKLKGEPQKNIEHFGKEATIFLIKLS